MAHINQPNRLNSPSELGTLCTRLRLVLSLKPAAGHPGGITSVNLRRSEEVTRFEERKELVHPHYDYGHIISLFGRAGPLFGGSD